MEWYFDEMVMKTLATTEINKLKYKKVVEPTCEILWVTSTLSLRTIGLVYQFRFPTTNFTSTTFIYKSHNNNYWKWLQTIDIYYEKDYKSGSFKYQLIAVFENREKYTREPKNSTLLIEGPAEKPRERTQRTHY